MKKIADIPKLDRPREKLQQKGSEALSDLELVAVLLGRGVEGHDVLSVANRVLKIMDAAKLSSIRRTITAFWMIGNCFFEPEEH